MGIAGDEVVGNGSPARLVRQMGELDARPFGESLRVVVIVAADADAGIADLARIGFRVGDELGIGLGREAFGGGGQHERDLAQPRHHQDILVIVDLELLLVDDGREHVGSGIADLQRVAVGLRARHVLDGEDAKGARLVLDHHRLAENRPHMLADDAHHDVGGAAGPERHDDLDRFRGIFLLRRDLHAADSQENGRQ